MKKHLSLMLVFLLLLGMTAFASVPADPAQTATKLYYKQDFNYANFDVFAADVYYNDLTVKTATATAADVAGARTAGLNMMTKKSNFSNAKWSISNKNSNGNNMLEGINSLGDTGFSFITDESWVANANEKYIISFELTSNYLPWGGEARTHYNIHVIGKNGTEVSDRRNLSDDWRWHCWYFNKHFW